MKPKCIKEQVILNDGRIIDIETGLLANQADGAVVVRMGNTMLLATVVSEKESKNDVGFLPLVIDYREKYSAGGKIPGGFMKREGRYSDEEILTMRLVDRMLRPVFFKNFDKEVQIMISLLSYDRSVLPDGLAGFAAATALAISGIPFNNNKLVSSIRVVRINNNFILNPGLDDVKRADIDLIIGATYDSIIMIEGEMKQISEDEVLDAIYFAHNAIKLEIDAQNRLISKCKSIKKITIIENDIDNNLYNDLKKQIINYTSEKIYNISKKFISNKNIRNKKYQNILNKFKDQYNNINGIDELIIDKYFVDIKKDIIRKFVLEEKKRLDGRNLDEIRPIWCEIDYLPGAHGSAIFTRGETQSLTTVTLGSSLDVNKIDNVIMEDQEKFYLHYNFPPFCTGEVRLIRGVSRREVGHGNLAKKALKNIIYENTPYTIRVVSDILESNGSSSMATVCAGTLALMDAGISIKSPVSGIAMGLIMDKNSEKYVILSDILGDEDYIGDMDFKISGTELGITACQMDVKNGGISCELLKEIFIKSKNGYLYILKEMLKTISKPREKLKKIAPKIFVFTIPREFIGAVIGAGGRVIQEIQSSTNTTISIQQKGDIGSIEILGKDYNDISEAVNKIKSIVFIPKVGEIYKATVKSIKDFGAFLELSKGVEGLLHISEIDHKRINKVEDVLKIGDKINVKLLHIDVNTGKLRLSRKAILYKNN